MICTLRSLRESDRTVFSEGPAHRRASVPWPVRQSGPGRSRRGFFPSSTAVRMARSPLKPAGGLVVLPCRLLGILTCGWAALSLDSYHKNPMDSGKHRTDTQPSMLRSICALELTVTPLVGGMYAQHSRGVFRADLLVGHKPGSKPAGQADSTRHHCSIRQLEPDGPLRNAETQAHSGCETASLCRNTGRAVSGQSAPGDITTANPAAAFASPIRADQGKRHGTLRHRADSVARAQLLAKTRRGSQAAAANAGRWWS
jgi:hypothetical protein